MFVQGQQEIGLYSTSNIPAQTELFFDYNNKTFSDKRDSERSRSKALRGNEVKRKTCRTNANNDTIGGKDTTVVTELED
jgi:hypothetical protein